MDQTEKTGPLFDRPEQVNEVLGLMNGYFDNIFTPNPSNATPEQVLGDRLKMFQNANKTHRLHLIEWPEQFRMIGSCVLKIIGNKFDAVMFIAMLTEKHKLYTAKPIREWGELGVAIRIASKWSRWKEVMSAPAQNEQIAKKMNETSDVTIEDILGYAVLGYLHAKERVSFRNRPSENV